MSVNSDFYFSRAAESARDAERAELANVRERFLQAEAVWRGMAERLLRAEQEKARHEEAKAMLRAVGQ